MRILFVHPQFFCKESGTSNVVGKIVEELLRRGTSVDVLTTDAYGAPPDWSSRRYRVFQFRVSNRLRNNKIYVPLDRFVLDVQSLVKHYDLIHLNEYRSIQNFFVSHFCTKSRIPFLLQPHGTLTRISNNLTDNALKYLFDITMGYRTLKNSAKIIALNETEFKDCQQHGVPRSKISIIPNGLLLRDYENLPSRGEFRRKYGVESEAFVLLCLGRIYWVKGIDVLVKAFANLLKKTEKLYNLKLVIAGSDDGFLKKVQHLTESLNLGHNVVFTGPIFGRDKLSALVDCDIFVLPSRSEAFPLTLLEAYACGKPVIASNVGGIGNIIFPGKTGFLVRPDDVEQLSDSILYAIRNFDAAQKMGFEGNRTLKANFSIESVVDQLEHIYESILQ